jgi:hypothetical protein
VDKLNVNEIGFLGKKRKKSWKFSINII